jgi:DNA-binding CsgD family transcriptional regulator
MNKIPKNQAFSMAAVKHIQQLCASMNNRSLIHFTHDITFGQRQISMLMNDANVLKFYFRNRIPAICVDESGRTLDAGVYLGKILKDHYEEAANILPMVPLGQNSIHFLVRALDCQHFYSFYFDLTENDFLHWVVNNGNLLSDFIDNYNDLAGDLLIEAKQPENRSILPLYSDIAETFNHKEKPQQIKLIHKTTRMPLYLAAQQSICLKLLATGKSAKEIGQTMQLSSRTIEHYLDRIRKILGCTSNRELLAVYGEQLYLLGLRKK